MEIVKHVFKKISKAKYLDTQPHCLRPKMCDAVREGRRRCLGPSCPHQFIQIVLEADLVKGVTA